MKFKNDIEAQAGFKDAGGNAGTLGQVLSSTVTGTSWIDPDTLEAAASKLVVIACKNVSGVPILKGTPVYQSGTVGATDVIEVEPADATISTGYLPAIGILQTTLNNNGLGNVVITGEFLNYSTSDIPTDRPGGDPFTGDTVYLAVGGGLTCIKPTGAGNAIQNVGLIGKVSGGNAGSITVSSIMRANDVPNLPEGRIWIGDGNTIVSDTVYVDEPNNRVGIGTTTPTHGVTIVGSADADVSSYLSINDPNSPSLSRVLIGVGGDGDGQITLKEDGNQTRVFINSEGTSYFNGGNVGIGTTSPGLKLEVNAGIANSALKVSSTDRYTGIQFEDSSDNDTLFYDGVAGLMYLGDTDFRAVNLFATGNVGIGTTSPNEELHVQKNSPSGETTIEIENTDSSSASTAAKLSLKTGLNTASIRAVSGSGGAGYLQFYNESSERMRITSSGNVGIGTTSPGYPLEVNGIIKTSTSFLGTTAIIQKITALNTNGIQFTNNGGSEKMRITDAGNVGIGTTSPQLTSTGRTVLDINGSSQSLLALSTGGAWSGYLFSSTSGTELASRTNPLSFTVNSAERMRITSTGSVLVNTNSSAMLTSSGASDIAQFKTQGSIGYVAISDAGNSLEFSREGTNYIYTSGAGSNLSIGTGGSEAMRITSSGNVGIGTTSPEAKLDIASGTEVGLQIRRGLGVSSIKAHSDNGGSLILESGPGAIWLNHYVNKPVYIATGGGNVGIGTTSPSYKLDVNGTARLNGVTFVASGATRSISSHSSAGQLQLNGGTSSSNGASINIAGDNYSTGDFINILAGTTYISGNVGIGTTSPLQTLDIVEGGKYGYGGNPILFADTTKHNLFVGDAGNLTATNTTGGNVGIGENALESLTGGYQNTAIGYNALQDLTTGVDNFALGAYALSNLTTTSGSVAIGSLAGQFSTGNNQILFGNGAGRWNSAANNIAIGQSALGGTSGAYATGYYNVGIGTGAMNQATSGQRNVGIGYYALNALGAGSYNVAIGMFAGSATVGSNNIFIGNEQGKTDRGSNKLFIDVTDRTDPLIWGDFSSRYVSFNGNVGIGTTSPAEALSVIGKIALNDGGGSVYIGDLCGSVDDGTDNNNVGVGNFTLFFNTSGYENVATGHSALLSNETGYGNTANGYESLTSNSTGYHNTAAGYQSLFSNTTGTQNTALGKEAGRYAGTTTANQTGTNSVFLGHLTKANANGQTNQIVIGSEATGIGSNTVTLGNDSIVTTALKGNVGIGTTSPAYKLDVRAGSFNSAIAQFTGANDGRGLLISTFSRASNDDSVDFNAQYSGLGAMTFSIGGSEKMRVHSTGNVGIGTTSPGAKLEVNGTINVNNSGDRVIIADPADGSFSLGDLDGITDSAQIVGDANTIKINNGGSTTLTSTLTNRIGIGTTSPVTTFHVEGTNSSTYSTTDLNEFENAKDTSVIINNSTTGTYANIFMASQGPSGKATGRIFLINQNAGKSAFTFQLRDNSHTGETREKMRINGSGKVSIGNTNDAYELDVTGEGRFTGDVRGLSFITTSQRDQKEGITDITKTKAKTIPFKEYTYKSSIDSSARKRYGVVAEDIENDYPELVHTGADGIKGVNYIDLLVKRVAELEKELEDATGGFTGTQNIVINSKGTTATMTYENGLLKSIK